ncbi:hypothetical protein FRC12_004912 [Ceratobasidium sp. 428]|nr:hypothetical protein FRC12_004912 [Ceratobasidium sp. 428]
MSDICAILGLVDGNMLALEALSIRLLLPPTSVHDQGTELGSPPLNDLLDLLARSPHLRTFQVTKFDYVTGKISSCFSSLKNITRLELMLCVAPVISDLRSLLLNNPHLETLVIEIDDPYATDRDALSLLRDDDTTSVTLTRLQTLVLVEGISSGGWSLGALQLIDAPSLISFRLDIDTWPAARECDAIIKLLCNNNCMLISPTLRYLSLGLLRCSSDPFRELFALCPNLVRLDWVVEQNRRYSLILSRPSWVLPKLSWMRISGATIDVPLDYILAEIVTERRKAELPLRVVEVGESHWNRLADGTKYHLQNVVGQVGPFDDAPAMESRGMEGGEEDDEEDIDEEDSSEENDSEENQRRG